MKDSEIIGSKIKEAEVEVANMQIKIATLNNHMERLKKIDGALLPYSAYFICANEEFQKIQIKNFRVTSGSISCTYIHSCALNNNVYEAYLDRIALTDEELKTHYMYVKANKLFLLKKEIEKQKQNLQEIKVAIENNENEESILEKELEELSSNNDIS